MSPGLPGLLVALAVTLVAPVYDIGERRIPNWLVLVGLAAAVTVAALSGDWTQALAGGGVGFTTVLLPRLVAPASVGLGDAKLAAAVGGPLGVPATILVLPAAGWRRSQSLSRPGWCLPVPSTEV